MTELDQLKEEGRDKFLENLTEDEVREGVKFSPELIEGEGNRMEFFKDMLKDVDINELKEMIPELDLEEPGLKTALKNEYGFTEKEIEKGEAYLEELKANPDMIEYDIENEEIGGPIITTITTIIIVGAFIKFSTTARHAYHHEKAEKEKKEMIANPKSPEEWFNDVFEKIWQNGDGDDKTRKIEYQKELWVDGEKLKRIRIILEKGSPDSIFISYKDGDDYNYIHQIERKNKNDGTSTVHRINPHQTRDRSKMRSRNKRPETEIIKKELITIDRIADAIIKKKK